MAGSWEITEARQRRVLVAVLAPPDHKVSMNWAMAVRSLDLPVGSDIMRVIGFPWGFARNSAIKAAYVGGYGYCFFLDADTVPPPDAVQRLIAAGRDIVGGLYHQRFPPYAPAVFMRAVNEKGEVGRGPLPPFRMGDIIPVDFLPTGCMLISRRAIEAAFRNYKRPFEWTIDVDTPLGMSEDYRFCQNLQQIGFQPWLHSGVTCGHEVMLTVRNGAPEYVQ